MTKEVFLSILRHALTAVGSYFIGKFFLGDEIDNSVMGGWIATLVTLASVIWGVKDKSATVEQVQSGLRSVVTVIGGILVSAGIINDQTLASILGILAVIIPLVYSQISKFKNKKIAEGEIRIADLSAVDPHNVAPDTTPVKTKK